jgi:predicted Zn-dependent protease
MKKLSRRLIVVFACCLWPLLVAGCATNPATGRQEFMIVSEEQEFRFGQQLDKKVREEAGFYLELPQLRSLVKETGKKIASSSHRPNLIYRIEIVDSPTFNAFAAPGGFIYVHRGLVERMNSVDELASVLSHEIAHVAARHSAAQISKAQLMNIGLFGLTIATKGAIRDFRQLIELGAVLAFNKFSRDDEREADYFGTQYMQRAGYNPMAAIKVMEQLERRQIREPSSLDVWFMTHPPTTERLENIDIVIEDITRQHPDSINRAMQRNRYVRLLEGLAVGEWNGNEMVSGSRYYNKEFLLSLEIPKGWHAKINSKKYTAVFVEPEKEFVILFEIEPLRERQTTSEYFIDFEKRLKRAGLRKASEWSEGHLLKGGALVETYKGYERARGDVLVRGGALAKEALGYSFIGLGKTDDFDVLKPQVESMIESLRFISESEAYQLNPPRLRIHTVVPGETWALIMRQYFDSSAEASRLAEYNGLDASREPEAGTLLKIPPSLRFF